MDQEAYDGDSSADGSGNEGDMIISIVLTEFQKSPQSMFLGDV